MQQNAAEPRVFLLFGLFCLWKWESCRWHYEIKGWYFAPLFSPQRRWIFILHEWIFTIFVFLVLMPSIHFVYNELFFSFFLLQAFENALYTMLQKDSSQRRGKEGIWVGI